MEKVFLARPLWDCETSNDHEKKVMERGFVESDRPLSGPGKSDQLWKYADDLVRVYQSEKEKQEKLQAANVQLAELAYDLEKSVNDLKANQLQLKNAYLDTINRLMLAAEFKDEDTGDHIVRMSRYSVLLAQKLKLPSNEVENIRAAAPMHDIGKIGIPDNILLEPGKLTDEEFNIVKTHTTIGAKLLANSKAPILQMACKIAGSHHEKWNGRGYPQGLSRESIPLAARIVGLADVFDALTSRRPYKDPYPVEVAVGIIKEERGEHFDPYLTDIFLENVDEFVEIKEEISPEDYLSMPSFMLSQRDRKNEGSEY